MSKQVIHSSLYNTIKFSLSLSLFIVLAIVALPQLAISAESDEVTPSDIFPDFAPPDLSAFHLLGVSPTEVARPSTVRELAISTVNGGSGGFGSIAPDLAMEWSPYMTFSDHSFRSYQMAESRMLVTFGTAKIDSSTRVAIGYRWAIVDKADPVSNQKLVDEAFDLLSAPDLSAADARINHFRVVAISAFFKTVGDEALKFEDDADVLDPGNASYSTLSPTDRYNQINTLLTQKSIDLDALDPAVSESLRQLCNECSELAVLRENVRENFLKHGRAEIRAGIEQHKKEHWNATTIQFAIGLVSNSPNSTWEKLKTEYWKVYLGGGFKMTNKGQLLFQISYDDYIRPEDSIRSKLGLGTRLMLGGVNARGTAELHYSTSETDTHDLFGQPLWSLNVGGEMKLAGGLWLELTLKNEFLGGDSKGKMLTLANFRYALTEKPNK